jgi:hypothetical protein
MHRTKTAEHEEVGDALVVELMRLLETLQECGLRLDRIEADIRQFRRDLAREQYEKYL